MSIPANEVEDLVKLAFFANIAKSITGAHTVRSALEAVMTHIGTVFAPRSWSLFLRDSKTGDLIFTIVTGSAVESLRGVKIPAGKGIVGWIADKAQPLIIDDVTKDPRFDRGPDSLSGFRTKSIIGVPLVTHDKVIGVIELVNELDDRDFTPLDLKILQTIADFAAIAIERNYYHQALRRLSSVDALTGIANRRLFERLLEREKERTRRSGKEFCVLMIDVNDFKTINDDFGHAAGDEVLRTLAKLLVSTTRNMDTVARFGGDEFVVLLPDTTRARGEEVRQRILDAISAHSSHGSLAFTVSVGLETAGRDSSETVLEGADHDMYLQKQGKIERSFERIEENLGEFYEEG